MLSPTQVKAFRDRTNKDGSDARAIDSALENVKSEEAEASVQADLEAIHALIEKTSGGYSTINATVKQYLRRWFVSHGGVKVAARRTSSIVRKSGHRASLSTGSSHHYVKGSRGSISVEQNTGPGTVTGDVNAAYLDLACEGSVRSAEVTEV